MTDSTGMPGERAATRALVVDDEPLARDELSFLLGELGVEVVAQASNCAEALASLDSNAVDVAFVDLRMPGPDGLALAEALARRVPHVPVVIVSAHDEGAVRGFEVGVVDYLLKPVRMERLRRALDRVRARMGSAPCAPMPSTTLSPLSRLAVRRRGVYVVVDLDDVIYFETKDELVWAVTREDRFALDLTLASLEERLPDSFFRSHRGAIVRIEAIVAIEPAGAGTFELRMDHPDAPRIPLARERARALRERIPIAG